MKKLFALLIALVMLLSCTALAEPSTAYTVAVLDPVIHYNGEPILDMTGLDAELTGIVSDIGAFALQAFANVGAEHEISALFAQAQLDTNGLTFTADGLDSVYSFDLAPYLNGFDLTTILPSIPAYTFLNTLPIDGETVESEITLDLATRYALINALLGEYVTDGAISVDKTAGELAINQLLTMLETAAAKLDVEGIAELRQMRPAFDLTGSITTEGDPTTNTGSFTITGEGFLYAEDMEAPLPYSIEYTDETGDLDFTLTMSSPDSEETAVIALTANSEVVADGRVQSDVVISMLSNDEEAVSVVYTATPVEGSAQMDYILSLAIPADSSDLTFCVSTGTNGDDIGFTIDLFVTEGDNTDNIYLYYAGEKIVEEQTTAISGAVSFGVEFEDESYAIDLGLILQSAACDTADWMLNSGEAIAIESLSEEDAAALEANLDTVLETCLMALVENIPSFAALMGMTE